LNLISSRNKQLIYCIGICHRKRRPVHVKAQYMQLSISVSDQFLASAVHDQKIAFFFVQHQPCRNSERSIGPMLRFLIWMVASAK
jgi:hypothetical protein